VLFLNSNEICTVNDDGTDAHKLAITLPNGGYLAYQKPRLTADGTSI